MLQGTNLYLRHTPGRHVHISDSDAKKPCRSFVAGAYMPVSICCSRLQGSPPCMQAGMLAHAISTLAAAAAALLPSPG